MKQFYGLLLLLSLTVLPTKEIFATHVMGATIGYTYIGGDTFNIFLKLYRDCNGIIMPNKASVKIQPFSTNNSYILDLDLLPNTGLDVTPVCNLSSLSPCNPINVPPYSVPVGIEEYEYQKIAVFPPSTSSNKFKISYEICCRNNAITNIINPGSSYIVVTTTIDRNIFPGNSSSIFIEPVPVFGTANQLNYFNFGAIDLEGDSLAYELYIPRNNIDSVTYITGLSSTNPFTSNFPITFDNSTGIMTVIPDGPQITVVGVRVKKYRNGTQVGALEKDIQIIITNDVNAAPLLTGIDSTNNYLLYAYPGDTVAFKIYASDTNASQSIVLENVMPLTGSTYNVTGTAQKPIGNFQWIVDSSHMRFRPHLVGFTATDDGCPIIADITRFIKIYVLSPNIINVWPGDADNNKVADVYDLLPIGIAYGSTGLVRANATTNWTSQLSADWTQSFANSLNYKYADANGDGVVDSLDIDVVNLNYGMTHQRTTVPSGAAAGDLYIELPSDSLMLGQTVTADIYFGSQTDSIKDLYGLAFKIIYDAAIVEQGTVNFTPDSWLGIANQSIIHIGKELNGSYDVAISRKDQTNRSGYGKMGTLEFKIKDTIDLSVLNTLSIGFSGVKAISSNESDIPVTTGADTASIISNPALTAQILGGELTYTFFGSSFYKIRLDLHRDCSSGSMASTQDVIITNGCNQQNTIKLNLVGSGIDVTPSCPQTTTPCDTSSGADFPVGVEQYTYEAVVTIPTGTCFNNVNISYSNCCRSVAITNLVDSVNDGFYIDIELNANNSNNHAAFASNEVFLGYVGHQLIFNFNAFDPDGDSLNYELYHPQSDKNTGVAYIPGLSYKNPLWTQSVIDTTVPYGGINVVPSLVQISAIGIKVNEFRNGTLIGYTKKDMVIIIEPAPNNKAPEISGINNTNQDQVYASPGDTVSFFIYASDADSAQNLTMQWNQNIPGANFTVTGTPENPVGHFYWIISQQDVRPDPYVFNVKVNDDNCPIYLTETKSFQINIFQTGIVETTNVYVKIYPNPAKDILTIETETEQFNQLTFFNIQGKLIFESHIEKGKADINVKDLPAGIYIVNLKGAAVSISKKVIVE